MNHHHRKILHQFFAHPLNPNISMREAQSVFRELGAEIDEAKSGKIHVKLSGHSANFSHGGHSLPKDEVMQIRKFLETCGVDPERDYPL